MASRIIRESRWIPSTGREIRIQIFRRTEPATNRKRPPGILWIHGGGYVVGGAYMFYMSRAKALVEKYGAVVIAPDYRLAREKPYPAALDDCYAALCYLRRCADQLGVDDSRIMVGGESAGGGLAVAVCMLARDRGTVNIAYQMPLYPMLDDRDTESSRDNHAPIWNTKRNHWGWKKYLGDLSTVPAYAAPARQTDCRGLPPAYTFVGDIEPFYCETMRYIARLKAVGVEAQIDVYPNWFHGYDMLFPFTQKAKAAIAKFEDAYAYAAKHYFAAQEK